MTHDSDEYGRPRTYWIVVIDVAIDQERPPRQQLRTVLLAHLRDEEPPRDADGWIGEGPTRVARCATFTLTVPRDPDEDLEQVADLMLADLQTTYAEVRRTQAH
jgi:hypothetical protein